MSRHFAAVLLSISLVINKVLQNFNKSDIGKMVLVIKLVGSPNGGLIGTALTISQSLEPVWYCNTSIFQELRSK